MSEPTGRHMNSQAETIDIVRANGGEFDGQLVLRIHDDPPPRGSGIAAPMLLDAGTCAWLAERLTAIEEGL